MQGMRMKNHKNQASQNAAAQRSEVPFNHNHAANQKSWQPTGAPGKVIPMPAANTPTSTTPNKTNFSPQKTENSGGKKARK